MMLQSTRQNVDLDWLLDELVERVPPARQAVVLSADGLLLGASAGQERDDAEHLCALASGLSSLARGTSRHVTGGPVRQTVVEMESAFLFVTTAGQGACLAVVSDADADIGLVAYEMAMLVTRVGETMSIPARPTAGTGDVG
ncbi:roadblock/LC7 domain-containing protein [Salinispora cortesiana]|uniref:roadblock/LC7 domain-containing protein n=1 Tax=Salinispora cortesiana TaxID=1305843 RepID=UPI000472B52D|nr:roadblock/LC7 domain-containing protein [Salinispora cortesiana]